MSISLIPVELQCHIVVISHSVSVTKVTSGEIKNHARQIANICLSNKIFSKTFSESLLVLKKINHLVNKYHRYNTQYEFSGEFDPKGNPQLLDALLTGCRLPFADSTFQHYTAEIEQDIIDIVKLTPQSMHCILGTLRCRDDVPPLVVACINVNIPLHIIEYLLQQGANPNATLKLNGRDISILEDLRGNLNTERFSAIRALFIRYGAVESY